MMFPVVAVVVSSWSHSSMLVPIVMGVVLAAVNEPVCEAVPSGEEALQEPIAEEERDEVSEPARREEEEEKEKNADIHKPPRC